MYVSNYGSSEINVNIKTGYTYTQYTIANINVTNGQAEIGFFSDANAGQFNSFDDVEFFKQETAAAAIVVQSPPPAPAPTPLPNPTGALVRTGWTLTASTTGSGSSLASVRDGFANTRWTNGRAQTTGGTDWIRIDLGATKSVKKITLDVGTSTGDHARGYQVYASTSATSQGTLVASSTTATGPLTTITFAARNARYLRIRLNSTNTNWWSIGELHVFP